MSSFHHDVPSEGRTTPRRWSPPAPGRGMRAAAEAARSVNKDGDFTCAQRRLTAATMQASSLIVDLTAGEESPNASAAVQSSEQSHDSHDVLPLL